MASDRTHPLLRPLVPPPEALASLRVRFLLLAFWIVMGAMETAKEVTTARLQGIERTVGEAILVNFPWWFFWVAGTLLVVTLAERWPIDRPGRIRAIAAHALTAAALSVVHLTLVGVLVFFTVARGGGRDLGAQVQFWVQGYVVLDFFVYWMVLGAYYALLYHRRWVEGALRESEARALAMRLEAEAVGAKLRALQMELNPHFLFNALNAVSGLVEEGRSSEATTVIARLGELLRTTLRRGDQREITLEEELSLVALYLDMERVRFGPRLGVEIDAPHDDVLAARVPPMILQPLVENAVRHGAAKARGPVGIRVRVGCDDRTLRVAVEDDGPGWPPSAPPAEGTGLSNVRARLETLYGDEASVVLGIDPTGPATRAEITLPFRNGDSAPPA